MVDFNSLFDENGDIEDGGSQKVVDQQENEGLAADEAEEDEVICQINLPDDFADFFFEKSAKNRRFFRFHRPRIWTPQRSHRRPRHLICHLAAAVVASK